MKLTLRKHRSVRSAATGWQQLSIGLLLVLLLALASADAKPEAEPKAKAQDPNEDYNYGDYGAYGESDYGEEFYGKAEHRNIFRQLLSRNEHGIGWCVLALCQLK